MSVVFFGPEDRDLIKLVEQTGGQNNGRSIAFSLRPRYLSSFHHGYAVLDIDEDGYEYIIGYLLFTTKIKKYGSSELTIKIITYINEEIASILIDKVIKYSDKFAITLIRTSQINNLNLVNLFKQKGFYISNFQKIDGEDSFFLTKSLMGNTPIKKQIDYDQYFNSIYSNYEETIYKGVKSSGYPYVEDI